MEVTVLLEAGVKSTLVVFESEGNEARGQVIGSGKHASRVPGLTGHVSFKMSCLRGGKLTLVTFVTRQEGKRKVGGKLAPRVMGLQLLHLLSLE